MAFKWDETAVKHLTETYQDNKDSEAVAAILKDSLKLPVTKRMVIGKLVSLGLYEKPEAPVKTPKDDGPAKKELLSALKDAGFKNVQGIEPAHKAAIAEILMAYDPDNALLAYYR